MHHDAERAAKRLDILLEHAVAGGGVQLLGHPLDPEIGEIDGGRLIGRDLENGAAVGRSRRSRAISRLAENRRHDRFRQALVVAMNVGGGLRLGADAFRNVSDRSAGPKLLDQIIRLGDERLVDLVRALLSLDFRFCFFEAAIVRRLDLADRIPDESAVLGL